MKLAIILLSIFTIANASLTNSRVDKGRKINYEGYKVYKIESQNKEQRNEIHRLAKAKKFSIWREDVEHIDLMVNPEQQFEFENLTVSQRIQYTEMISNLQSVIDEEQQSTEYLKGGSSKSFWTQYNDLSKIEKFLNKMLSKYPKVTEEFIIGKSYEGRTIRGIKISYKSGNPGIFIESNIHATEWLTSATATWIINELLSSRNKKVRKLARKYDWYIVPVLNVDGFVYTHEVDRLWRKTRQPYPHSDCIGADANRNFEPFWMLNGGASDNACEFNYAGPSPYSEPEAKQLADYLKANKDKINIYLAFHTYGQVLLSPWGYTADEYPPNYDHLMQVGKAYADAVGALPYNTTFTYGTFAKKLWLGSGTSTDYAYQQLDIKILFTVEMRDKGTYGFLVPPEFILPNCEETMAGMLALVKEADTLGYLLAKY